MEWLESIRKTVDYIEQHLLEVKGADEIAEKVYMSSYYLQKGFKFLTGYSITEYIRSRRLYQAAFDLIAGREKIIDIAYKYGYDTPESFTKAFSRFHGASPTQVRRDARKINTFLPLKITISIQGGNDMDYVVEKRKSFQVVGFEKEFSFDTSYQEIPQFWSELYRGKIAPMQAKGKPETELEKILCGCHVGEYGICIEKEGSGSIFRYLIAGMCPEGVCREGSLPEGMVSYEVPEMEWAKFSCKGPMPGAMQAVNSKIFKEWLPGNPEYEIAMGINIEWYSKEGNTWDADYQSEIWIPVKRKK